MTIELPDLDFSLYMKLTLDPRVRVRLRIARRLLGNIRNEKVNELRRALKAAAHYGQAVEWATMCAYVDHTPCFPDSCNYNSECGVCKTFDELYELEKEWGVHEAKISYHDSDPFPDPDRNHVRPKWIDDLLQESER